MSESVREPRPQFGFLSAVGLFFLAVLAVLVALYFYNAEVRQVGDGAIGHARAYKQTILSDYSRFYECMRGVAPASAQAVRAESPKAAQGTGPASAPVVVYPPYADYPTYPSYPDGAASARSGMPPGVGGLPSMPNSEYGRAGASHPSEQAVDAGGTPQTAMASPPESQPGFAMQAGPMMQGGPDGPAMPAGPTVIEPQAGPSMQAAPSMEAGPIMQTVPAMPPSAQRSLPGIQSAPTIPQGPVPGAGPYGGPYGAPYGAPYGGRYASPAHPPGAAWQGRGLAASGMPPSGMTAPMPYGQGSSAANPVQPGLAPAMPDTGPSYGAPQAGPAGNGPQGAMPPPPWSRYSYGTPASPGMGPAASPAPAVIPATPTMPLTSMMPPPAEAVPVLPADASQVDPQIVAARQAAANQQHQDAIRIYRGYISRNASDPSAFGELGNVLLSAGRPQEAAQAYYEASSRLIDLGQPGTVYLLLPHIEQHDPLLGAVLMRRLASLPRSIY